MCGIVGIVSRNSPQQIEAPLRRAIGALSHRGPDDEGFAHVAVDQAGWSVAFGHQRLAILDLTEAGHQPMLNRHTTDWITYNGEVFNFRDVRSKLEDQGYGFSTESDTEVLLTGLDARGVDAAREWRGMFALGWWDASSRKLTLLRDRLGIKPLYYFFDGNNFVFASEIRALLATGLVPRRVSTVALQSYLAYGSVEQPLTIIENVYSLLPGHSLVFSDGVIETQPYWEVRPRATEARLDADSVRDEVLELLVEAVRLRLVSDVPVGVFLSGGIDSSAVVSLVRRATSASLQSFSVCFKEEELSEQEYAEQVARHFGTTHHSVLLTVDEALAKLPGAIDALDQPTVDGINSWIVSEAAASAGLKVALSGLGGDELFAGYSFFSTIERDERRRRQALRLPAGLRSVAASAVGVIACGNRATKLRGLLKSDHLDEPAVRLHRRLFTDEQIDRLLDDVPWSSQEERDAELLQTWNQRQIENCSGADVINQTSALELTGYMSNTLLRDTDTMSMAHGLEVRVPLIDHRLVEKLMSIPGDMKLRTGEPKWLLVDAVGDLPREIVDRPKRGFELPFKRWLMGPLREQIEASMRSSQLGGVMRQGEIASIWTDFLAERVSWSRVWGLFALNEWWRKNMN